MRRRSSVWLVAVAHALTPPAGLRKLTRSVASPELLDHNDAVTFLQETGVPTFAADEAWLELDDAAPSTVVKPVDGADAILIEHALTPEECERLITQAERAGFSVQTVDNANEEFKAFLDKLKTSIDEFTA